MRIDPLEDSFDEVATPERTHEPTEVERLVAEAYAAGAVDAGNKLSEVNAALEHRNNEAVQLRTQLVAALDEIQELRTLLRKATKDIEDLDAQWAQATRPGR